MNKEFLGLPGFVWLAIIAGLAYAFATQGSGALFVHDDGMASWGR